MHSFLYFHNGSIGDFLMTLYFMELLHKQDASRKLSIFVPKYGKECRELAKEYPYLEVLTSKIDVLSFLGKPVISITSPTPGVTPLKLKLAVWTLSLFGGSSVGFDDGKKSNSFFYSKLLEYDQKILYYKTMQNLAAQFGEVEDKKPQFYFQEQGDIFSRYGVKKGEYFILHPRGSDEKRSLNVEYAKRLIECLLKYEKTVFVSGISKDIKEYESLVDGEMVVSLAGTTLTELATLLKECKLYIGVDTGITHLAALSGAHGIALLHPGTRYPWIPCYSGTFTALFGGEGNPKEIKMFNFPEANKVCEQIREEIK